ncbi:hypothetical protein [Streptomyces sp. NPDC048142]|uniref:hypothetical protein n=1 Tax=Streptomyces sp. NPDC048142 TaxID=3365501 RepID=UPI003721C5A8
MRTLWLYGRHLPAEGRLATGYPWPGASDNELKSPAGGRSNKWPRIAPATMTSLLAWALHVIEAVGPDARDAWVEYHQLQAGTHASQAEFSGLTKEARIGPAAGEYRHRVRRQARFAGRVVTACRNVQRLLDQTNPNIQHGEAMTCVWRLETAACHKARLDAGLPPEDGPNEAECQSSCTNLVYTDRNIVEQRRLQGQWEAAAADQFSPRPLRDRAAALAKNSRAIIEDHHADPADTNPTTKEP